MNSNDHRAAALNHLSLAASFLARSGIGATSSATFASVDCPQFVGVANFHASLAAAHAALANLPEVTR